MAFPLNVIIASAVRTPVGRALKGTLRSTRPEDLAAAAMVAALARVPGLKAEDVDDVILGCAMPEAEQGLNIARNAVFLAKWPNSVPAETINRFCSSGLQAIAHAALSVQAGLTQVSVAGGVESMSMVPMSGNKVSLNPKLMDEYPEAYIAMGHTAENVAQRFDVSRAAQDAFAVRSHERALAAIAAGRFNDEIVPVKARVLEGSARLRARVQGRRVPAPGHHARGLGQAEARVQARRLGHRRQQLADQRRRGRGGVALGAQGRRARRQAARPRSRLRAGRRRPGHHGHRPGAGDAQAARRRPASASPTSTCSRSTRRSPRKPCTAGASSASPTTS